MTTIRRLASRSTALTLLAAALAAGGAEAPAAAQPVDLKASYAITLAIFTIGRVDISGHFTDTTYSADIKGLTTGLGRLVSDSHAELQGSGAISGTRITPAAYQMQSSEADFDTTVNMTMHDGTLNMVDADPQLAPAPDRVPLTADALARFVDPVSALMVVNDSGGAPDGKAICNRTIPVFDGWVRYDIALSYKGSQTVSGRGNAYSGPVIVCTARYVPVAGHRQSRDSVNYMAQNQRLEAWVVPVKGTNLMVPYKFIIGTAVGDLSVTARDFVVTPAPAAAPVVTPPTPTARPAAAAQ